MSVVLLDQSVVHYEVLGRGRPILFLHGWVGSWRYWIASMQVASTSFRAYALDLWGFGDTAREPERYTLDRQADLVALFLEQMGIGKVALVGHGLGALVACAFAMRSPASVDRLMVVNCPLSAAAIHARLRAGLLADLVDWLGGRTPAASTALSDATRADPRAVLTSMASLQSDDFFSRIPRMSTPCLLVHGQNDPAVAAPATDQLLVLPHNMQPIMLEDAGHFPMIDDTSRFNRLLTDFLALASGDSPRQLQLKEEWRRRVR